MRMMVLLKRCYKPLCYYVMNNGCIVEENAMFKMPHDRMKNHLKPIFIWVKVDNIGVNKLLVDGGAIVNLIPHFLLKKIRKFDIDLRPHNMVFTDYDGKTSKALRVIQVYIVIRTAIRLTLLVVISYKENYNLLLGREWIHGMGVVPSTLHQRV